MNRITMANTMKCWWRVVWAVLWVVLVLCPTVQASEAARTFMNGTEAYEKGDWQSAIVAFESLADQGIENGKLFYDLGNAYLKNGDLGHALLWYERAKKRIPDDPDLYFNYEYALTLCKDEQGETTSPLLRILFFWKYQMRPSSVLWVAIVLNAALWIAMSVLAIRKKPLLRPSIVLLAAGTILFTATELYNAYEAVRIHNAIILPEAVSVRSGLTDSATELFVLHAGTKVRVERESDTHIMIRYTKDKIGWVKQSEIGVI